MIQLRKKNDHLLQDNAKFVRENQSHAAETKKMKNDLIEMAAENLKLMNDFK